SAGVVPGACASGSRPLPRHRCDGGRRRRSARTHPGARDDPPVGPPGPPHDAHDAAGPDGCAVTVFDALVGQDDVVQLLQSAVAGAVSGKGMTHAWHFTGPPGSGRSVAARAFAAALQCPDGGCGQCQACHTALGGTHADVRFVVPEGLTIGVGEMRSLVMRAQSVPTMGRWQVLLVEDADRLTEQAGNALLKAIEEPPPRTVFLLCTPSTHPDDISVTIRSRCRLVTLRQPPADAVAAVLVDRDGVPADTAAWAAAAAQGHVGRARRLAADPQARSRRDAVL